MLILLASVVRQFSAPGEESDEAALVIPEELLHKMYNALEKGGELVYERGFLRKGVGICHGVAGSVFALLAVSKALDPGHDGEEERVWFKRALHLAQLTTNYYELEADRQMDIPDRPYSLYEGVAGMVCAWADVLRMMDGERSLGIPGYDDLGL